MAGPSRTRGKTGKGSNRSKGKGKRETKGRPKGKGKAKGKTKGKRKGKKGSNDLPEGLEKGEKRTTSGEKFCFGFNLGTCSDVKPGEKCRRGWHKCMYKGCEKNHAFVDHK